MTKTAPDYGDFKLKTNICSIKICSRKQKFPDYGIFKFQNSKNRRVGRSSRCIIKKLLFRDLFEAQRN
jgi:hypothetical protein